MRAAASPDEPITETLVGRGSSTSASATGIPRRRACSTLGVTALPDGSVLIADTYNGAIRRYAPARTAADGQQLPAEVSTVARGLKEPSDVMVDADGTSLLVVETNAHQLVRVAVPEHYLTVDEGLRRLSGPRRRSQPASSTSRSGSARRRDRSWMTGGGPHAAEDLIDAA